MMDAKDKCGRGLPLLWTVCSTLMQKSQPPSPGLGREILLEETGNRWGRSPPYILAVGDAVDVGRVPGDSDARAVMLCAPGAPSDGWSVRERNRVHRDGHLVRAGAERERCEPGGRSVER